MFFEKIRYFACYGPILAQIVLNATCPRPIVGYNFWTVWATELNNPLDSGISCTLLFCAQKFFSEMYSYQNIYDFPILGQKWWPSWICAHFFFGADPRPK